MGEYDFVRIDLFSFIKGFGIYSLEVVSVSYRADYKKALLSVTWDSRRKWLHVYLLWLFEFNLGNAPLPVPVAKVELEEEDWHCYQCGSKLQIVRPGKYQCPECE